MTREQLEAKAKARWNRARAAFEKDGLRGGPHRAEGLVNLLAMTMCLAAIEGEPLKHDIVQIARSGGLIP